jgi:hypothetical protein
VFVNLARQAGVEEAEGLADQLSLLYDSAMVGTQLNGTPASAVTAREAAQLLVAAAVASRRKGSKRRRPAAAQRRTPRARPRGEVVLRPRG